MYRMDDERFIDEIISLTEEFAKSRTDYIFKYDLMRLLKEYKHELVADTEEHLCACCEHKERLEIFN